MAVSQTGTGGLTNISDIAESLLIFHDNIELIMPGQASVTVAVGSQKSFVLKKIMNIPPPNILADQDDGKNHKTCQYVNQIGYRSLCSLCVCVCL